MKRDKDELKKMRKAGRVVAEMHAATRAAAVHFSCISATTRPALRISAI